MIGFRKVFCLLALPSIILGCAKHNLDYLKEADSVPPIRTSLISPTQIENYYPVPVGVNHVIAPPPPLDPPNSNLQRFKSKKKS